jgi:regulator of protease activity HflC (stomatin/prohibitin superfamily)
MLASPDSDGDGDGFNTLEDIVILPVIRAIFRNNAESKKALEYVQNRTQIEKDATAKFAEGLSPYRVTTDGVFIGENGLTDTQEGKSLMATQTDKEVALQEKATFQEQKLAQEERAKMVKAEEDANQEKNKAIARAKVDIAEQEAQAEIKMAEGRAQAYLKKLEALGGVDNFVKLEMLKMSMEKWQGTVPNILLMGGSGGSEGQSAEAVNALLLKLFQGGLPQPKTSLKSKNSTTQRKVDLNKIYK